MPKYFSKSTKVMRKLNNFWHVKPRSLRVQNVACYIPSIFFDPWDRLRLTTVCVKLHFIILSYDSSSQQDGCLQTNEMVLNSRKQTIHSFQATPHFVEHNRKSIPLLGVLQWIEAALMDILRDTGETAWPSVLDEAEEITACK